MLRQSIEASLQRLLLSRLDLFFLHSNIVPDQAFIARGRPDAATRMTPYASSSIMCGRCSSASSPRA